MKSTNILFAAVVLMLGMASCSGNKTQRQADNGEPKADQLVQNNVSAVAEFSVYELYDAISRTTLGGATLTLADDYGFNGKDSVGQYRVTDLVTDTTNINKVIAKHLILMKGQDTIAIVDNDFDVSFGALKQQTVRTRKFRISNLITWDENYDNIASFKQNMIEYDKSNGGVPVKERQMDVSFNYFGVQSMNRWSNGMARMLVGEDLDILVFSGLMGNAPSRIPASVRIFETESTPAPEFMVLSQKEFEGDIKYEVDNNFLVIKEHFYDPHYTANDFTYIYE